jgi:DNA-binding PadR family transcriptional regulator
MYHHVIYSPLSMAEPNSPLAPAAFLILFALAGGDKHGYAIMREARLISEGGFEIGPATLYTTIQRLLESCWIEEVAGPESSDSRRRYYSLTQQGSSVLNAELKRMETLVRKSKAMRLRNADPIS